MGALEAHAQGLQPGDVHVDGPGPEVVAARQGDARPPAAGEHGAQHDDRGPHLLDEGVRRLGRDVVADVDGERVVLDAAHVGADGQQQVAHDLDVHDVGDVAEHEVAGRHEAGRHQLQGRVLGALDAHAALERRAAPNHDLIHALSMVGVWPGS